MRKFLLLLLVPFMFMACKDKGHEPVLSSDTVIVNGGDGFTSSKSIKTKEYNVTYKYADGAQQITNDDVVAVVDDSTLIIKSNVHIEPNAILTIEPCEKLPYGFAKMVRYVMNQGDWFVICKTVPLDEIFTELEITSEFVMEETSEFVLDDPEVTMETEPYSELPSLYAPGRRMPQAEYGNINELKTFNFSKTLFDSAQCKIVASAKVKTAAVLKFDFSLLRQTTDASLEFVAQMEGDLTGTLGTNKAYKKWQILQLKKLLQGKFVVGPVVLCPHLDLDVDCEAGIKGDFTIALQKDIHMKVGYNNNDGAYFKNFKPAQDKPLLKQMGAELDMYVQFNIKPYFGMGIYNPDASFYIKPQFDTKNEVSVKFEPHKNMFQTNPQLHSVIEFEADLGIGLDFIKINDKGWSKELKVAHKTLFDTCLSIIPQYKEKSLKLNANSDLSKYTIDYGYTGGLLVECCNIKPCIRLHHMNGYEQDIESDIIESLLSMDEFTRNFKLPVLKSENDYTAIAMFRMNDTYFPVDSVRFTSVKDSNIVPVNIDVIMVDIILDNIDSATKGYHYEWHTASQIVEGAEGIQEVGDYDCVKHTYTKYTGAIIDGKIFNIAHSEIVDSVLLYVEHRAYAITNEGDTLYFNKKFTNLAVSGR